MILPAEKLTSTIVVRTTNTLKELVKKESLAVEIGMSDVIRNILEEYYGLVKKEGFA